VIYSLKLKFYFLLLGIITLIFFLLVYPHASNHTFQTYYGLLWFSLASCVTFNFIENIIKQKYIIYLIISLFVFIHLFLSVYFIISFYGLFTDKIYDKIDAYGTYESYAVGQTLKYILEETNNNSGYILVQSPTVYYPSYRQSLTYHEVYSYDLEKNDYLFYNYFKNQSEFLSEIENRNIILMTITPDVFYTMSNEFLKYKNMNFVDICYTKNFVISMNETVFHNSPEIKINCINFLNNMTKNDNLANNTISNQWLESASILTKIEKNFENSLFIDKNFKEFNGLKLNKNNFTILLFLNSDNLVNNTDIVTLKDQINTNEKNNIWRVRFGGNNDIYLEIPKAMDGYSWMEGVYYYPQLNLPTCVVFMYSPNNYGTYINAVKKSETFFLLKNEERLKSIPSDLNFTQNQSLIIGSENFKGKIKTFIFNQTFSDTDIFNICLFPEEFNFSFTSEILDESYS